MSRLAGWCIAQMGLLRWYGGKGNLFGCMAEKQAGREGHCGFALGRRDAEMRSLGRCNAKGAGWCSAQPLFSLFKQRKKSFVTAAGIEAALAHQRFAGSAFSPFAVTRREDRVGGEDGTRSRIRRGPSAALMARWDSGFGRGNPLTRGLGREWVGMAFAAWCGRGGAPFLLDGKFVNNCTNRKRTLEIRLIF